MEKITLPDFDLLYRQVRSYIEEHQNPDTGFLSTVSEEDIMYAMCYNNMEDAYGNPTYTEYPILAVRVESGAVEIMLNRPGLGSSRWESLRYSDDVLFIQTLLELAYTIETYVNSGKK